MSKYKKIYILAPYHKSTGGIELSHQLIDYLRNHNQEAYVIYIEKGKFVDTKEVTESYRKYNIEVCSKIEDKKENMLVLPEIFFDLIYDYHEIQLACWWMSVDNRYYSASLWGGIGFQKGLYKKFHFFVRSFFRDYRNSDALLRRNDERIIHLYQSRYAQHNLYSKGFSRVLPLSDYINTELAGGGTAEKEDIIIYNPAKGLNYTKRVLKELPSKYKVIALKGFNRSELKDIMSRAKLYIDFGAFPGKDRLPREAILNGCCIITGKNGASFYYEDVAIGSEYKFDTTSSNVSRIVRKIDEVMSDYYGKIGDFEFYKKRILEEEKIFYSEIDDIFLL